MCSAAIDGAGGLAHLMLAFSADVDLSFVVSQRAVTFRFDVHTRLLIFRVAIRF